MRALLLALLVLPLLSGCDEKDPLLTRTYTLTYTADITGEATVDDVVLRYTDAAGAIQTVPAPTLPFTQAFTVNRIGQYTITLTGRYRGETGIPLTALLSVTAEMRRPGEAGQSAADTQQYRQTTDTDASVTATLALE
jgi:hypothetical protein